MADHEEQVEFGEGNGAAPADRANRILAELLSHLDPDSAPDQTLRRMLDNALARAAQAEEELDAARERIEWLTGHNVRDEVTGCLNLNGFGEALAHDLSRARRYGETGALMLVDLVDYRENRAAHGPAATDYMLTAVANILHSRFRDVDRIGRLRDGRFAVALTMIGVEDARRRSATLKSHLNGVAVPWRGENLPVRVRVGLVHYGQRDAVEDLLERAESELDEREQRIARLAHPTG